TINNVSLDKLFSSKEKKNDGKESIEFGSMNDKCLFPEHCIHICSKTAFRYRSDSMPE
ncbi:hypothetical protein RDWZM_000589, partial [Blomia tropicalis]